MLRQHIAHIVPHVDQQIPPLATSPVRPDEIVSIYFAQKNCSDIEQLNSIKQDMGEGEIIREKIAQPKTKPKEKKSLIKDLAKKRKSILEKAEKYKNSTFNEEVVQAYIIFRSMEGAARFLEFYKVRGCCKNCLPWCCDSLRSQRRLAGYKIRVEKAVDPTLIIWENMGYSQVKRGCSVILTLIILPILSFLALSTLTTLDVLTGSIEERELAKAGCLDPEAEDYNEEDCAEKQAYSKVILVAVISFLEEQFSSLLAWLNRKERHRDVQEELFSDLFKQLVMYALTQIFVALASQEVAAIWNEDESFKGPFSSEWYMESGTAIMAYYLSKPVAQIVDDLKGFLIDFLKRCYDRKFTCDTTITR